MTELWAIKTKCDSYVIFENQYRLSNWLISSVIHTTSEIKLNLKITLNLFIFNKIKLTTFQFCESLIYIEYPLKVV